MSSFTESDLKQVDSLHPHPKERGMEENRDPYHKQVPIPVLTDRFHDTMADEIAHTVLSSLLGFMAAKE